MRTRLAVPDDAEAIAEVHIAAWRAAYPGLMPQAVLDELDVAHRADSWRRSLSAPGATVTSVAMDADGAVVGFALYGPSRDTDSAATRAGELLVINLLPRVWRSGLGRELCGLALSHANKQEWQSLTLWVLRENERARAFYESMGFTPDGAKKIDTHLVGSPLHELRYRRQLDNGDPQ